MDNRQQQGQKKAGIRETGDTLVAGVSDDGYDSDDDRAQCSWTERASWALGNR